MIISVCVGSSCHMRGSYQIIDSFKKLIEEHELGDRIELQANFCVGECIHPVSVRIDEGTCTAVSANDVRDYFEKNVVRSICP